MAVEGCETGDGDEGACDGDAGQAESRSQAEEPPEDREAAGEEGRGDHGGHRLWLERAGGLARGDEESFDAEVEVADGGDECGAGGEGGECSEPAVAAVAEVDCEERGAEGEGAQGGVDPEGGGIADGLDEWLDGDEPAGEAE
ncbi:MAG: hypothetical protein BWX86_00665 [Verrucomicrobia bacterium ADurb.Bin122]|nr:MAG: hypothetical protein BWX86_00665 [Verrucomicrobia bacterium ADurb.Bin122]